MRIVTRYTLDLGIVANTCTLLAMGTGTTGQVAGAHPHAQQNNSETSYKKPTKRLLSTQEAADYLGISDTTFRRYRNLGQIPFRKVGVKLYKYHPDDLDAFAHRVSA